jgi:hypothetical protein
MSATPKRARRSKPQASRRPPTDLFKHHATPPSPLHEAMQKAARLAGWIPPWDREEQGAAGGKTGGFYRRVLPTWRRDIVKVVHGRLKPAYQNQPYSETSINAFIEGYHNYLAECCKGNPGSKGGDDFASHLPGLIFKLHPTHQQALKSVGRETLLNDLKAVGIRSKLVKRRPG